MRRSESHERLRRGLLLNRVVREDLSEEMACNLKHKEGESSSQADSHVGLGTGREEPWAETLMEETVWVVRPVWLGHSEQWGEGGGEEAGQEQSMDWQRGAVPECRIKGNRGSQEWTWRGQWKKEGVKKPRWKRVKWGNVWGNRFKKCIQNWLWGQRMEGIKRDFQVPDLSRG